MVWRLLIDEETIKQWEALAETIRQIGLTAEECAKNIRDNLDLLKRYFDEIK